MEKILAAILTKALSPSHIPINQRHASSKQWRVYLHNAFVGGVGQKFTTTALVLWRFLLDLRLKEVLLAALSKGKRPSSQAPFPPCLWTSFKSPVMGAKQLLLCVCTSSLLQKARKGKPEAGADIAMSSHYTTHTGRDCFRRKKAGKGSCQIRRRRDFGRKGP